MCILYTSGFANLQLTEISIKKLFSGIQIHIKIRASVAIAFSLAQLHVVRVCGFIKHLTIAFNGWWPGNG